MTFAVDETIFSLMMNYCVGVVVAEDVKNGQGHPEVEELLAEHMVKLREEVGTDSVSNLEALQAYREAYKKLGIDPEEYISSIEHLVKQASGRGGIPMVNPINDLITAVSLKYIVPMEAYDVDALGERLELRFAEEDDIFNPFGGKEEETVEPGELVYASGKEVKMRKWIWRRSDVGKVREETKRLFISIDGFEGVNRDKVIAARDEIAAYLSDSFQATVATAYLNYAENAITTEERKPDER